MAAIAVDPLFHPGESGCPKPPFLCEWLSDGEHEIHGAGPLPELETFAQSVLERLVPRADNF